MKTLVIHPKDITTDFLSEIYLDKDWTVINMNVSKKVLKEQIKSHDRIVMLGHGTERGLIGFGKTMLDSNYVYLLRDKLCVCIWCNADVFVEKYGLKGFYTGMIISEYEEAVTYGVPANLFVIENSNRKLAAAVKNSIDLKNMLEMVKLLYDGHSEVSKFNRNNLYYIAV